MRVPVCVWLIALLFATASFGAPAKSRVLVLTDIENEPDDAMSMVRFLLYANHFDVEGLVATTSIHQKDKVAAWRIREIVEAYAKVRDNLELHEPGFPSAAQLRARLERPAGGPCGAARRRPSSGRAPAAIHCHAIPGRARPFALRRERCRARSTATRPARIPEPRAAR